MPTLRTAGVLYLNLNDPSSLCFMEMDNTYMLKFVQEQVIFHGLCGYAEIKLSLTKKRLNIVSKSSLEQHTRQDYGACEKKEKRPMLKRACQSLETSYGDFFQLQEAIF